MAKKKIELKNMSEDDLHKLATEKQEALRVFRFGVSGSKIKNVKEGSTTKKEIARILTELSLRNIPTRGK